MSIPAKQIIYVLLITRSLDGQVESAVGPVFWGRIDAQAAARRHPYDAPNVHVQIVEREVRGTMPQAISPA